MTNDSMTNVNKAYCDALPTQLTVAEMRQVLSTQCTSAEIAAGETAMPRFRSHIRDEFQEFNVLAHVLREASTAGRAIVRSKGSAFRTYDPGAQES